MPEAIERKFIDLKALKMSNDGPGEISGYRSVFGEIDEGGDIVVKGFFADGISDYLNSGFTAHSHDWNFSEAVGFPIDAKEDEHGFLVTSQFHSTPDAQNIRTKAKERMDAGKTVGFSFGYAVKEKKYIEAKDFKDQLPLYVKPERLAANLQKAQNFNRIRILLKGETIEDSLVTSPMNKLAMATGVKSATQEETETKGMFEDALEERTEGLYFLYDVLCCALYRAQMVAANDTAFDLNVALDVILTEFAGRVKAGILDPEEMADSMDMESMANKTPISFKGDLRERLPFAKHAATVRGAAEVFAKKGDVLIEMISELTERRKAIDELRQTKAGAVYAATNLSDMQTIHDAIGKVRKDLVKIHGSMGDVISRAKKPEKSEGLDSAALRTRSIKAQSTALVALN